MTRLRIDNLRIALNTTDGEYGFSCQFKSGLNIVRGNNSSGKSTLINSLIYSLGMEELLGGKGAKTLPYALKNYVENNDKKQLKIISSFVFIEVTNSENQTVTFKRAIKSSEKDTKLVEVILGPYISKPRGEYAVTPTFLHDKGSAQIESSGFHSYLEKFIGLDLPFVPGTKQREVKLYLQSLFSSFLIEQKRGWTDYIANTPYYGIREVRTKVVEFLLNLDTFHNERERLIVLEELREIQNKWDSERSKIKSTEDDYSINVSGVKKSADEMFDSNLVVISKYSDGDYVDIDEYASDLLLRIESIADKEEERTPDSSENMIKSYNQSRLELDRLISHLDTTESEFRLANTRLAEYLKMKSETEKDLEKNKIARKLKLFGAEQELELAKDSCPACHQRIDDSIFLADSLVHPMSIDENIKYLESQRGMITNYISGLESKVDKLQAQMRQVSEQISQQRKVSLSLRREVRAQGNASESELRVKFHLESRLEGLEKAKEKIHNYLEELTRLGAQLKDKRAQLLKLPQSGHSVSDKHKLSKFQKCFRLYAERFGYKSAPTKDIEINPDTLLPYLSGIELREVSTDIKSDSSASDFVRLIWSYLLSLQITSVSKAGNHTNLIVLDEPGQHSMAVRSVNALLKALSEQNNLQSIVAASFDEEDDVFTDSVRGVSYHLVTYGSKLLSPVIDEEG